jgi:magnesium chelatase subunit H
LKLADRLPGILKFVPTAGALTDVKHYLYLFCYFLQPTPANIQSMLLYALKVYVPDAKLKSRVRIPQPEHVPSVAIYHPSAPKLFESFAEYRRWYLSRPGSPALDPQSTVGLLLMRPQVVSKTTKHYDALISAIEAEGTRCCASDRHAHGQSRSCFEVLYSSRQIELLKSRKLFR